MACCGKDGGLGWATPLEAFEKGEREKLLYVVAVNPDGTKPDYLATIDADPESATYSQVISRAYVPHKGDELHHSGWNACSSCYGDTSGKARKYLVLPALGSGRVYAFDVASDPRNPKLAKVVEGEEIQKKTGLAYLHSSHCLASGEVLVSAMGDPDGNAKGGFVLLDGETFEVKDKSWAKQSTDFGYDFW
jgi:selenium-binding protein 1